MSDKISPLKTASRGARLATTESKNHLLDSMARLLKSEQENILLANQKDLELLPKENSPAFRDRLVLNAERIDGICESLQVVKNQPDPIGQVLEKSVLENGLTIEKQSTPIGVLLFIFESRPNVLIEAFSIAIKSGNVMLAKPGKESKYSVEALHGVVKKALEESGWDAHSLSLLPPEDRNSVLPYLKKKEEIDLVIPRGGEKLIQFVVENSTIPVLKNDKGQCHIYVHEDADLDMAIKIVENAKVQRPSVCNSLETVLVHQTVSEEFYVRLLKMAEKNNVSLRGCEDSAIWLEDSKQFSLATEQDWSTEYLDLILNCRTVTNLDKAAEHIQNYGSNHSDGIVTAHPEEFQRFASLLDSAVVYWNASTRFTDGFAFGKGGEIGISTQKLHARGPIGLNELTTYRYKVSGSGQIR